MKGSFIIPVTRSRRRVLGWQSNDSNTHYSPTPLGRAGVPLRPWREQQQPGRMKEREPGTGQAPGEDGTGKSPAQEKEGQIGCTLPGLWNKSPCTSTSTSTSRESLKTDLQSQAQLIYTQAKGTHTFRLLGFSSSLHAQCHPHSL